MQETAISERAYSLYQMLIEYMSESGGSPPSFQEITEATGMRSTFTVRTTLDELAGAGLIEWTRGRKRSIRLVGARWTPPPMRADIRIV